MINNTWDIFFILSLSSEYLMCMLQNVKFEFIHYAAVR